VPHDVAVAESEELFLAFCEVKVAVVVELFIAERGGFLVITAVFIVETESFKDSLSTWTFCHLGDFGVLSLVPNRDCRLQPLQMITSSCSYF